MAKGEMKYLALLLLLSSCATHPNRFTYSDGYFEDLYQCYVYPSGFGHGERSQDLDFAISQAKDHADLFKLKYDYVECFVVK